MPESYDISHFKVGDLIKHVDKEYIDGADYGVLTRVNAAEKELEVSWIFDGDLIHCPSAMRFERITEREMTEALAKYFNTHEFKVERVRSAMSIARDGKKGEAPKAPAHFEDVPDGYEDLAAVLELAFSQAAYGKGKERHADELVFRDQPIFDIADLVGAGFQTGQAIKKTSEAVGMMKRGNFDAARIEFLGAIVYLAAAYIWSESQG